MTGNHAQNDKNAQRRRIGVATAILVLLFGAAAAWKWTPLADQIDIGKVAAWVFSLRDNQARPLIILAAYVIGTLLLVPITALIVATALVFGPLLGTAYSFAGCLLGAAITYAIGYYLGKDFVRKLTGRRWHSVEEKIGQTGIIAITTLRLLPMAPFTVVNVIAGAFQVSVRDYLIGSLLGLAPGIFIINLFARQVESAIRNPGIGSFLILAILLLSSVMGAIWLKRRLAAQKT